jgi:hypothetical protein
LKVAKEEAKKLLSFRISPEVFRARLLSRIHTALHFYSEDITRLSADEQPLATLFKANRKAEIERKVKVLFDNLGLEIGPDKNGEHAWLFDSIVKSIQYAPDFEELDPSAEQSPTNTYVLTSDDLNPYAHKLVSKDEAEKIKKGERTIATARWRLVPLEQFVLMQVISLKVMATNGNGRFEEWIYKKVSSDPHLAQWHNDKKQGELVMKAINNIYLPLVLRLLRVVHCYLSKWALQQVPIWASKSA